MSSSHLRRRARTPRASLITCIYIAGLGLLAGVGPGCGGCDPEDPPGADAATDAAPDLEAGDAGGDLGVPGDTGGDVEVDMDGPREVCDEQGDEDGDGWEECDDPDCASAPACQGISPSPAALAPSIGRGDILERYGFLFNEQAPIQREAQPEAFEVTLASHVRGQVVDHTTGDPVPGARVRALGQRFAGYMPTTQDGTLDMVVHGTGVGQVDFTVSAPGYAPFQTRARVIPGADVDLGVLRLIERAPAAPPIGAMAPMMQSVDGPVVTDERGTRATTLLMRPNTRITAVGQDGVRSEVSEASVRITEVSVGGARGGAMSAPLPAFSGYTWAADFAIEQALDAARVEFEPAVVVHLDEFLDFSAGTIVPLAHYDTQRGIWEEHEAARVVRVVEVNDGVASLDVSGGPEAEGAAELAELGISDDELAQIGATRQPGDSFWRMELPHFSTWDANMGLICDTPDGTCTPLQAAQAVGRWLNTPSCEAGSLIECDNRSVLQSIGLMGSSHRLHHRSDWQPGYSQRRILRIPIAPTDVIPEPNVGTTGYELKVMVAGRLIHDEFYSPSEGKNMHYVEIEWDGLDAYGRPADDRFQIAQVQVDVLYQARETSNPNFNDPTGSSVQPASLILRDPATLAQRTTYDVAIEPRFDDSRIEAGGWMISGYHQLLPNGYVKRGDGGTIAPPNRATKTLVELESGAGGPIAALRSGELVVVQGRGTCLVRLDPNRPGSEEVILGECPGDTPTGRTLADYNFGQPATDSLFGQIAGVHVAPNGDVYVWQSDTFRQNRPSFIARIRPDSDARGASFGPLEHIAGNGDYGAFTATASDDARTQPVQITDLAVSPNGEVYVVQEELDCVLRVGNRGRLTPFAGQCQVNPPRGSDLRYGERLTGSKEYFGKPNAIDVAPDGLIYVSRSQLGDIVRVGTGGLIEHVAGSSSRVNPDIDQFAQPVVDGTDARLVNNGRSDHFSDLVVAPDGSVYVIRTIQQQINRIDADLRVWIHATDVSFKSGLEISATGEVLLDRSPFEPWLFEATLVRNDPVDGLRTVVDDSGLLAFVFDDEGRHVRTQHSMSHEVLERFVHDARGRLVEIIDEDARSTVLTRDVATGRLESVTGPDGQTSTLSYNAGGELERVTWADGKTVSMTYDPDARGLIREFVTPRGFTKSYTYSDRGLLESATDETGATKTYSEEPITENNRYGRKVTRTSADGRQKTWEAGMNVLAETLSKVVVDGLGRRNKVTRSPSMYELTASTGDVVRMFYGADPHFGQLVDRLHESYFILPSGDVLSSEHTWEATYADDDPTQLATLTRRTTQSGVTGESIWSYDVASRTITTTSPEGRRERVVLDERMRVVESRVGDLAVATNTWDQSTGRLTESTLADPGDPAGARSTTYEYIEAPGQLATGMLSGVTDAIGRRTEYDYDLPVNLERVLLPALTGNQSDGERTLELERDDDGNLVRLAPFGRDQHLMVFDARGGQTSSELPSVSGNMGASGATWVKDAMLESITDVAGEQVTFTYDPDVRQLARLENSAEAKRFTHDPTTGQLIRVDATGKQPWASDRGYEFEYDGSRLSSEHWLDGQGARWASVGYGHDDAFRVDLITIGGSPVIPMEHDDDGLVTLMGPATMTYLPDRAQLSGMTVGTLDLSVGYDAFGAPVAVGTVSASGDTLLSRQVTRDRLGRITAVTEAATGQAEVTTLYGYDPQGRLATVHIDDDGDGVGQPGELFEEYERDERGNEVSLLVAGGAIGGFAVNAQDQVTQHGDTRLTYNARGQADSVSFVGEPSRALTLEHDPDHVLRRVTFADGATRTYDLDAFGRQAHIIDRDAGGVTTGARHYLYLQGSNPIAQVDAAGNPLKTFIYATGGNAPDAIVDEVTGDVHVLIKDEQGSVRVVADAATGQVLQRRSYTSHGLVLTDTNPGFQPFGFHGGMHDERTGLIRFGVRHYLPELGRFIAPDPFGWTGGHTNLYAYAAFDPVNLTDPTGLYAESPADVASTTYSVGAILRDNVFGNCDNLGMNLLALGADVATLLLPGLAAGGAFVRAGGLATKFKRSIPGCSFTEETTVRMCDGELRSIAEVSVGEYVMARDPDTGADACREVTALHRRRVGEVYELELTDEAGRVQVDFVTGEHPYKVAGGAFVPIAEIAIGEKVESMGSELMVTGKATRGGDYIVYNLSVDGFETFFVGEEDVLVHNCDIQKLAGRIKRLERLIANSGPKVRASRAPKLAELKAKLASSLADVPKRPIMSPSPIKLKMKPGDVKQMVQQQSTWPK